MKCIVKLIWNDESCSWHCESEDIPGLVLGSNSFDALITRIRMAAPEMLELNCNYTGAIELVFQCVRTDELIMLSEKVS